MDGFFKCPQCGDFDSRRKTTCLKCAYTAPAMSGREFSPSQLVRRAHWRALGDGLEKAFFSLLAGAIAFGMTYALEHHGGLGWAPLVLLVSICGGWGKWLVAAFFTSCVVAWLWKALCALASLVFGNKTDDENKPQSKGNTGR
ncbi:MAG: hypothetical protein K8T25_15610 [Planctomycetia bacterium]|nr:hypothetical protein [Planctomycetia bacterium]